MEGRPLDDGELVDRARRGDGSAYEQLIQRYQAIAHRVAYVVTRSAADADDATQEAFVKAYYALGRFRSGASFRPWILKIVANEARNRRRAATRRADLAMRAAAQRSSGDAAPSPEAAALEAEERTALLGAVNRLSDKDRLAVTYRYFLGLSEADMAAALGCATGTVKSRLSRALTRLRRELEDS
ncbi:MAG: RNA polymerase sigma factor [Actinomycetota bacterium]